MFRLVAAIALAVTLVSSAQAGPQYSYNYFNLHSGAYSARTPGINDAGQVVGTYNLPGNAWNGFLRQPGGLLVPIVDPNQNGYGTQALGINNSGTIVGDYDAYFGTP